VGGCVRVCECAGAGAGVGADAGACACAYVTKSFCTGALWMVRSCYS